MENLPFDIDYICREFSIPGRFTGYKTKSDGIINKTYVISFDNCGKEEKYTLQNINTYVFKNPYELMKNISAVTSHIHNAIIQKGLDPQRRVLSFLAASDGNCCCKDENANFWRLYHYIDGVYTLNTIDKPSVFEACGRAFGEFQNLLSDFDGQSLYETIENFHNTKIRLEQLKDALKTDAVGKAKDIQAEIEFIISRESDCKKLAELTDAGLLPIRVTHNDTKLNNVLFDNETDEGICIIDLDTVMPGLSLYDFGDSVRFGANKVIEDEPDTSKVGIDLNLYESYTKGYLSSCADKLNDLEKDLLPFSVKVLALELGIRFLTDYLNGDLYFKITHPMHNLERCRNQLALSRDIEINMDKMKEITQKYI